MGGGIPNSYGIEGDALLRQADDAGFMAPNDLRFGLNNRTRTLVA